MEQPPRVPIRRKKPFMIGVAGGVSSGKSSVCTKIVEQLAQLNNEHKKQIMIISFDSFYRHLTPEEQLKAQRGEHNFDHPSSFDDELAYRNLMDLINGKEISLQIYDNKTYSFKNERIYIKPGENSPDVLIVEGILVFYYPKIRDLFQMKLFVDCDADTRLSRRVLRDMCEYKRDLEHILSNYTKSVKPAFEEFCLPTKKYADVIIPRGAENSVAINLIVQHIDDLLNSTHHYNNNHLHLHSIPGSASSSTTNGIRSHPNSATTSNDNYNNNSNSTPITTASTIINGSDVTTTPKSTSGGSTKRRGNNNTSSSNQSPNSQGNNEQQQSPSTPSKRNDLSQRPH